MERDRFNEVDTMLCEAERKIKRLEVDLRKKSDEIEVQELKIERLEEAKGKAKSQRDAKEAEAEAEKFKVMKLGREVDEL